MAATYKKIKKYLESVEKFISTFNWYFIFPIVYVKLYSDLKFPIEIWDQC